MSKNSINKEFLLKNVNDQQPAILLTGENADSRFIKYDEAVEGVMQGSTTVARYKHLTGEYATSSAIALRLACEIIRSENLPLHMIKKQGTLINHDSILIYNHYKGRQHSFMLVRIVTND